MRVASGEPVFRVVVSRVFMLMLKIILALRRCEIIAGTRSNIFAYLRHSIVLFLFDANRDVVGPGPL